MRPGGEGGEFQTSSDLFILIVAATVILMVGAGLLWWLGRKQPKNPEDHKHYD